MDKQKHLRSARHLSNFIGMFLLRLKQWNEKKNTFKVVKFSKGNFGKGKILIAYRLKDGRCNLKCLKFKTQNISRNTEKQTNVQGFHP